MKRSEFIKNGVIGGVLINAAPNYFRSFNSSVKKEKHNINSNKKNVLWEELTWKEIKSMAEKDAVVIVPVGSIEQHGPHLPVNTDILISSFVSCRVAEIMNKNDSPALVTPRVWTGNSSHHMIFPGTISFDYSEFYEILKKICISAKKHGFSRIVFLNGHGGNSSPLRVSLVEINKMLGRPAFTINYWSAARGKLKNILDTDSGIGHAAEAETSIMLALRPDLVKRPFDKSIGPDQPDPEEIRGGMAYTFRTYEDRTDIGVIGNAGSSSKEKGEQILDVVTNNLAEFLMQKSLWEITL